MKKLLLVFCVLALSAGLVYAVTVDTKVSSNTVSFNTISFAANRGPQIVTFNSVTKHIRLMNLSKYRDCYADIKCVDASGKRGYATNDTLAILLPALGNATPNTVEFDFSTHNLGFRADSVSTTALDENTNNLKVTYTVTGEQGEF